MKEPKIIDCDDHPHPATGTYTGSPQKPEALQVNDLAALICHGITVLVTVTDIKGDTITGIVRYFENYDEENLDDVMKEDMVQFERKKIQSWQR